VSLIDRNTNAAASSIFTLTQTGVAGNNLVTYTFYV
jgi:hypothetical protein